LIYLVSCIVIFVNVAILLLANFGVGHSMALSGIDSHGLNSPHPPFIFLLCEYGYGNPYCCTLCGLTFSY